VAKNFLSGKKYHLHSQIVLRNNSRKNLPFLMLNIKEITARAGVLELWEEFLSRRQELALSIVI